ncbi:MAG: hypothetical protein RIC35_09615 [Marinoscillum sp.]
MKIKSLFLLSLMVLFGCTEDADNLSKFQMHRNWKIEKLTITYMTLQNDTDGNQYIYEYYKNIFLGGTVEYMDTTFIVNDRGTMSDFETVIKITPTDEDYDPNDYRYQQVPFTFYQYIFSRRVNPYDEYTYTDMSDGITQYHPSSRLGEVVITERPLKGDKILLMITKNESNEIFKGSGHFELELSPQ